MTKVARQQKGYAAYVWNTGLCGHIHKTEKAARECGLTKKQKENMTRQVISTDDLAWSWIRGYYLPTTRGY